MSHAPDTLLKFLPPHAGRYATHVPLGPLCWFRVGGCADVVFKPHDIDGLSLFLKHKPSDLAYIPLGVGSNVLIREGGVRGAVIRLTRSFCAFSHDGLYIDVGAGLLDRTVAERCCALGLGGFEFLHTIPGTLGGALRMNAGAYGVDISQCLVYALALDPQGTLHRLTPGDMQMGYRQCGVPQDWIFVGARLKGYPACAQAIRQKMDGFEAQRKASQPVRVRTGGSTFANPDGHKAWELIDQSGCRGLTRGGAQISPKHCNFMVNDGQATARDLEALGEEVRSRVRSHTGFDLAWEIVRVGEV